MQTFSRSVIHVANLAFEMQQGAMMPTRRAAYLVGIAFALFFSSAACSEDWVQFKAEGVEPDRRLFLVDADSIKRDSSSPETIRTAILSEMGLKWPAQVVADELIDCQRQTGKVTHAEFYRKDGSFMQSAEGEPFEGSLDDLSDGLGMLNMVISSRAMRLSVGTSR